MLPANGTAGPLTELLPAALHRPEVYSPLVLYGPSGSGKSQLSRGLAGLWKQQVPDATIVVTSGTDFARELAAAVSQHTLPQWRAQLEQANLVVVEDLVSLASKGAAQQELIALLDAWNTRGTMVVVTTPVLPQQVSTLSARDAAGWPAD